MDDSHRLAIAIILALIAVAIASFELGHWRGCQDGRDAQQADDELRLVGQSRGRHPSRSPWTEPPSNLDRLDGINPPAESHPTDLPPVGGSAGLSAGAPTDEWQP